MDYSPQIWQRFREPRFNGVLQGTGVLSAAARTPASKAVLSLHLRLEQGRIAQARFQAYGCPSAIATGDWLCEWLEGRSPEEAMALKGPMIVEALGLTPTRRHCAVLAQDVVCAVLGHNSTEAQGLNDPAARMSDVGEVKK